MLSLILFFWGASYVYPPYLLMQILMVIRFYHCFSFLGSNNQNARVWEVMKVRDRLLVFSMEERFSCTSFGTIGVIIFFFSFLWYKNFNFNWGKSFRYVYFLLWWFYNRFNGTFSWILLSKRKFHLKTKIQYLKLGRIKIKSVWLMCDYHFNLHGLQGNRRIFIVCFGCDEFWSDWIC